MDVERIVFVAEITVALDDNYRPDFVLEIVAVNDDYDYNHYQEEKQQSSRVRCWERISPMWVVHGVAAAALVDY